MASINIEQLTIYRNSKFGLAPGRRLKTVTDAVDFVNQRGFIFFWPIKDVTLPSLWVAVAGNRPVADQHDDPGHVTWGWKDSLLGKRRWYYAKVLRKKSTIISLDLLPCFYALSDNYGAPDEDYLTLYEQGRMSQEAKNVYESLLYEGPMDTIALRRVTHLTSRESDSRFNRAIADLQADFKIVPIGVARAGGWNYAFIYDITAHHFHELPEIAHSISEREARVKILERYFDSVGAAQITDITRLFKWEKQFVEKAVKDLADRGRVHRKLELKNSPGFWIALAELAS
jgi:predicted transcriptional regulator